MLVERGKDREEKQEGKRWKTGSPQQKQAGVDFTSAMTHSRGRSCHGAEGVEEGEEWADVRVHRGRRPYGP